MRYNKGIYQERSLPMYPLIRRYLRRVDVVYLLLCAACSAISIAVLMSIGQTQLGSNNKASVQLIASLLGLMLAVVFSTADYHALAWAWPLHGVVAWGLVLPTLFLHNVNTGLVTIGYDAGGTSNYSWYRVGGMTFQPAELAKISFILTLALHLSQVRGQVNRPKNLLLLFVHIALPAAAIHVQGDDGTALVFRIRESACVHVHPYGAISVGQKGEQLADLDAMVPEVIAFSDDGKGVQSESLMREAMEQCRRLGKILAAHCEDNRLLRGGYIHDGAYAKTHSHRGICSESEWGQIARDVRLAEETGCAYHVCHVSTKESVSIIREAKRRGVNVTCETGPHYLTFTEDDLQEDGRFKMNPPLRDQADRDAAAAVDAKIEAIGTVTIGGQERPRNFVVKTMPALKAGENHTIEINF